MNRLSWKVFFCSISILAACKEPKPMPETPDSPARAAEEEILTFQIDPGLEVQLVASEPLVESPVIIQFDERGRLWVVEMRGYMNDIDGSEEDQPVGSVAILEDTDGDGKMDHRIVYLDSLIMPRALGLFENGALVAENNALWVTEDLDGDWIADRKTLLDSTYAANGIPEHSDNGFVRNLDNWYYSAKSRLRYRLQKGEWIRDSTEFRGQWGITQDDQGRLIYNYNWSQLHGDLVPPNTFSRNKNHQTNTGIDHGLTIDRRVYPIRSNLAVNRGYIPGTLDSTGRLLEFTSASAPTVYRASLLPQEYYGNMFVMENAGNLVKRNVIREEGVTLIAEDPNPGREFMASTDERFRPVYGTLGPDGGLYIADMYQGIVQHGSYMTDYLREQTLLRNLDQPGHMGRIWRIVPKGHSQYQKINLSDISDQDLISILDHSDGWYRDMAQRLLVEKGESRLVTLIEEFIDEKSKTDLGRIHALWTLEGLGAVDPDFLLQSFDNSSDEVQRHILRILEKASEKDEIVARELGKSLIAISPVQDEGLALQASLTASVLQNPVKFDLLKSILEDFGSEALFRDAVMSSLKGDEFEFLSYLDKENFLESQSEAKAIFLETLALAVVQGSDPDETSSLLNFIASKSTHWSSEAVLSALAIQGSKAENQGKFWLDQEPELFQLTVQNQQLSRAKNLFRWEGFSPDMESNDVLTLDAQSQALFADGRQKYLTSCAGCHASNGGGVNRMGPPLVGSEWVTGDERRLALILLHGIEGPISVNGKEYDAPEILPVMPSHSTMDDGSIAAILTYIRNEWGNQAGPISPRLVGGTRHTSQGRVYPWSADELNAHIAKLNQEETKPNPKP